MYMFVCECKCEYMSVTVCIWMSDDDKDAAACHPSCLRQGLFFTGAHTPGSMAWELLGIVSTPVPWHYQCVHLISLYMVLRMELYAMCKHLSSSSFIRTTSRHPNAGNI